MEEGAPETPHELELPFVLAVEASLPDEEPEVHVQEGSLQVGGPSDQMPKKDEREVPATASRRDTGTGAVLEQMVLPAIERGGYEYFRQVDIGERLGGGRHIVDLIAYDRDQRGYLISLKWQQTSGTGQYFLVAHISATYNNPLFVPLVSAILDWSDGNAANPDNQLTLSASEQMRVENPALNAPTSTTTQTC